MAGFGLPPSFQLSPAYLQPLAYAFFGVLRVINDDPDSQAGAGFGATPSIMRHCLCAWSSRIG